MSPGPAEAEHCMLNVAKPAWRMDRRLPQDCAAAACLQHPLSQVPMHQWGLRATGVWAAALQQCCVRLQSLTPDVAVQVGLAGPSGSGKTAFSQKIQTVLTGRAGCFVLTVLAKAKSNSTCIVVVCYLLCIREKLPVVAEGVMPAYQRAAAARLATTKVFCCFVVCTVLLALSSWTSDLPGLGVLSCWVCSA